MDTRRGGPQAGGAWGRSFKVKLPAADGLDLLG